MHYAAFGRLAFSFVGVGILLRFPVNVLGHLTFVPHPPPPFAQVTPPATGGAPIAPTTARIYRLISEISHFDLLPKPDATIPSVRQRVRFAMFILVVNMFSLWMDYEDIGC